MTTYSNNGLEAQGVVNAKDVHWNLTTEPLYEATIKGNHGKLSIGGALVVDTGKHTGRSPSLPSPKTTGLHVILPIICVSIF